MNDEECIDTSDAEEREALVNLSFLHSSSPGRNGQDASPLLYMPRKRRKVLHDSRTPSPVKAVPSSSGNETNDVRASSPRTTMPVTVSPNKHISSTSPESAKVQGIPGDNDGIYLEKRTGPLDMFDHISAPKTSQDELDVMSQVTTTPQQPPSRRTATLSSSPLTPLHIFLRRSVECDRPPIPDAKELAIASHAAVGSGSLDVRLRHASPGLSSIFGSQSPTKGMTHAEAESTPSVSTALDQNRFSSLPPSSPLRSPLQADSTPSRAQTYSPQPSQTFSSPNQNAEAGSSRPAHTSNEFDIPEGFFDNDGTRRYSLRARQARQLNPYKYDKHMYKRQLRGIPEAIVKLASPRRKARHGNHEDWDDDHLIQETQDEEWQAAEGDLDDEESHEWQRQRRRPSENRGTFKACAQERWVPPEFNLGDDELSPVPMSLGLIEQTKLMAADTKRPEKVKHPSRFPIKNPQKERQRGITADKEKRKRPLSTSPLPEQHDLSGSRCNTSPTLAPIVNEEEPSKEFDFNLMMDDANLDLVYDDFSNIPQARLESRPNMRGSSPDTHSIPTSSDENDQVKPATQRRRSLQISSSPSNESATEDDEGLRRQEDEEERERRKARRILGRMMPAVMINKVIKPKAPIRKPSQEVSSSSSEAEEDVNRHFRRSLDGGGDIAPGQSRVRRTAGNREDIQIRGDSESSDNPIDSDSDATQAGVNISEDERSPSISPDTLFDDDEAIEHDWIADNITHYTREIPLRAKRGEDLIDRMLNRTRTNKSTTRSRRVAKFHRMGRHGSKHDGMYSSVGNPLKNGALDVVISSSGRSRQPVLPFARRQSSPEYDAGNLSTADIGAPDDEVILLEYGGNDSEGTWTVQHNAPVRMTKGQLKKKRREQLIAKQTYTVPSEGRLVTSGRRKFAFGGDGVRVDFATKREGFIRALAPVRTDAAQKLTSSIARPVVTIGELGKARKPRLKKRAADWNMIGNSRQTTMHDYVQQENAVYAEFVDDSSTTHHDNDASHTGPSGMDVEFHTSMKPPIDLGIERLHPGLAFGSSTYIGRQWLHELVAVGDASAKMPIPINYDGFDIILSTSFSANECAERVEGASTVLYDWLNSTMDDADSEAMVKNYDFLIHALCSHSSWQLTRADGDATRTLQTAIAYVTRRLTERIRDMMQRPSLSRKSLSVRLFSILWCIVELNSRCLLVAKTPGQADAEIEEDWRESMLLLMRCLLGFGLKRSIRPLQEGDVTIDEHTVASRTGQIWICLIHLIPRCAEALPHPLSTQGQTQALFWQLVIEAVHDGPLASKSDFEASEHIWAVLFSLNCLSQVSTHGIASASVRLSPCWDLVITALSAIRLTHDREDDTPEAIMLKRDKYVRLVVSRCYLLRSRWHWRLNEAYTMFNRLVEIFKSRKYAGLLDEDSDFPAFLRNSNLSQLKHTRKSDTAFSLFLKLVVQAAEDDREVSAGVATINMRKILSLAVPLTAVPFSKDVPPTSRELSMLYNRFSALVVALYLDPSTSNIRARIAQARRYVSFSTADLRSRQACVRAAMYASVLLKHLMLSLDEPLLWMAEMTDILLEEFRASVVANFRAQTHTDNRYRQTVVCLQMLLGSVRFVIESRGMDPDAPLQAHYPDVALLDGPWIRKLFATKELTSITVTRQMILKLLQAFLDARSSLIAPTKRPSLAPLVDDSDDAVRESQDEFGHFDLDWDDPELIAALEQNNHPEPPDEDMLKDQKVAEIMDVDVTPAVYRLVMQNFSDAPPTLKAQKDIEEFFRDTDEWINCWVRCAAIVVQCHKREWSHYLDLGPQSWNRIGDSFLSRRVGLQFMYRLLMCHPVSYKAHQDSFLEVFFDAMVTTRVSVEHEYICLLLSIDGLRHQMLRRLPIHRESEQADFYLSKTQFTETRLSLLEGIISNISASIEKGDTSLERVNQTWVGFVLRLLSTMKEIYEACPMDQGRQQYRDFCAKVMSMLAKYPHVQGQQRLTMYISWGFGL